MPGGIPAGSTGRRLPRIIIPGVREKIFPRQALRRPIPHQQPNRQASNSSNGCRAGLLTRVLQLEPQELLAGWGGRQSRRRGQGGGGTGTIAFKDGNEIRMTSGKFLQSCNEGIDERFALRLVFQEEGIGGIELL